MTHEDRKHLAQIAKLLLDAWVNANEPRPLCECGHPDIAHKTLGCSHRDSQTQEGCVCIAYKVKEIAP